MAKCKECQFKTKRRRNLLSLINSVKLKKVTPYGKSMPITNYYYYNEENSSINKSANKLSLPTLVSKTIILVFVVMLISMTKQIKTKSLSPSIDNDDVNSEKNGQTNFWRPNSPVIKTTRGSSTGGRDDLKNSMMSSYSAGETIVTPSFEQVNQLERSGSNHAKKQEREKGLFRWKQNKNNNNKELEFSSKERDKFNLHGLTNDKVAGSPSQMINDNSALQASSSSSHLVAQALFIRRPREVDNISEAQTLEQSEISISIKQTEEVMHPRLAIQTKRPKRSLESEFIINDKGRKRRRRRELPPVLRTDAKKVALESKMRLIRMIKSSDNYTESNSLQQNDNENKKNISGSNNNSKETTMQQIQELAYQRRRTLMELKQKYMTNRAINDKAYYILLLIYSLFITVGTISNSLICLTVILKPKILSPRNIFIFNLAGSDLLLCVFTMPFSFIEISMKRWQMGLLPCKLVAGLQATSIFVSTISITAIALDRYRVIVYPTHQETTNGTRSAVLLLALVWFVALLLSLPLFSFRTVEHWDLPLNYDDIKSIDFCVEAWPFAHGRGIYSVISMIFQYVLPITIVSVVYAKISDKLQKRLIRRQKLTQLECQQKKQLNLIRRTHTMLISVSLIFGLSWLPLNLLNLIGDFTDLFGGDDQLFRIVFAICHLIGCSSACSNPILYGYLNENFRKEFHQVYTHHVHQILRLFRRLLSCICGNRNLDMMTNYMPSSSSTIYSTSTSTKSSSSSSNSYDSASSSSPSSTSRSNSNSERLIDRDSYGDDETNFNNVPNNSHNSFNSQRNLMLTTTATSDKQQISLDNNNNNNKEESCNINNNKNNVIDQSVVVIVGTDSSEKPSFLDHVDEQKQRSSINNQQQERMVIDQASRKFSLQALANGKQRLDKSMRFCLCISGLSSSDSLQADPLDTNSRKAKQTHNSEGKKNAISTCRVSERKKKKRKKTRTIGEGEQQSKVSLELHPLQSKLNNTTNKIVACNDGSQANVNNNNNKDQSVKKTTVRNSNPNINSSSVQSNNCKAKKSGKHKKKKKKSSRHRAENYCECQCHKQQHKIDNNQTTRKDIFPLSIKMMMINSSKRVSLNNVVSAVTNNRRPSAAAGNSNDEQQLASGRRVWLRFFPAKERYLKVSTDKNAPSLENKNPQQQSQEKDNNDNIKDDICKRRDREDEDKRDKKVEQRSILRKQHCLNCKHNHGSTAAPRDKHKHRKNRKEKIATDNCAGGEQVVTSNKRSKYEGSKKVSTSSCQQTKNLVCKVITTNATPTSVQQANKSPKTATSFIQGLPMNMGEADDDHDDDKDKERNINNGTVDNKKEKSATSSASASNKITGKYFLSVETARRKQSAELTSISRDRTDTSVIILNGNELDSSSVAADDFNNNGDNNRQTTDIKLEMGTTNQCYLNKEKSQSEINNIATKQDQTHSISNMKESNEKSTPSTYLFSEVSQGTTTNIQSGTLTTDNDKTQPIDEPVEGQTGLDDDVKINKLLSSKIDKQKFISCCPFVVENKDSQLVDESKDLEDHCSLNSNKLDIPRSSGIQQQSIHGTMKLSNSSHLTNNNEIDECHSSSYVCMDSHTTSCSCSSITSSIACQLEDEIMINNNIEAEEQQQLSRMKSHTQSSSLAALAGSLFQLSSNNDVSKKRSKLTTNCKPQQQTEAPLTTTTAANSVKTVKTFNSSIATTTTTTNTSCSSSASGSISNSTSNSPRVSLNSEFMCSSIGASPTSSQKSSISLEAEKVMLNHQQQQTTTTKSLNNHNNDQQQISNNNKRKHSAPSYGTRIDYCSEDNTKSNNNYNPLHRQQNGFSITILSDNNEQSEKQISYSTKQLMCPLSKSIDQSGRSNVGHPSGSTHYHNEDV